MSRISVLVVDDSVVVRRLLSSVLDGDPEITVVGTAASGVIALSKLPQVAPDCVVLDIEMPDMDGLTTLRELRKTHPRLPVIMFSTLTERGAGATLDALSAGANDYVTKPSNAGSAPEAMARVRDQLIPKIKALCPAGGGGAAFPSLRAMRAAAANGTAVPATPSAAAAAPVAAPAPRLTTPSAAEPAGRVDLLAIGASTGGPEALTDLLPRLPASFPVPVVVVQHMPPVFTRMFSQRLDRSCALDVKEAEDGDLVVPGRVLVAAGDRHLELRREGGAVVVRLTEDPPENFSRPSVDVTFRSASRAYGRHVLAVVLTGMGSDGARGAEALHRGGARVYAQDQASSVVWGMPSAVVDAGLAHRVVPLDQVAQVVLAATAQGRSVAGAAAAALP